MAEQEPLSSWDEVSTSACGARTGRLRRPRWSAPLKTIWVTSSGLTARP